MKCFWCGQDSAEVHSRPFPDGLDEFWQIRCDTVGCEAEGPLAVSPERAIELWAAQAALESALRELVEAANSVIKDFPDDGISVWTNSLDNLHHVTPRAVALLKEGE